MPFAILAHIISCLKPKINRCHLSVFSFTYLLSDQEIVPSPKLQTSSSFMRKNKSFQFMLYIKWQRPDPWGTPLIKSFQELKQPLTLSLKSDSHLPKKCCICFNENPLKRIKGFVCSQFLSWLSGQVEKTAWLES